MENGGGAPEVVRVTGSRTVAPSKSRCSLATFDLPYITFYYNQKLLLYRTPVTDFPDAVARVTASLADALRVFFPLAGRIRQDADGSLAVEGDEGAEVLEAEAEAVAVDDLAAGDCAEDLMQRFVPYTGVMNLEGLRRPLLAVQVTYLFICLFIDPYIYIYTHTQMMNELLVISPTDLPTFNSQNK